MGRLYEVRRASCQSAVNQVGWNWGRRNVCGDPPAVRALSLRNGVLEELVQGHGGFEAQLPEEVVLGSRSCARQAAVMGMWPGWAGTRSIHAPMAG